MSSASANSTPRLENMPRLPYHKLHSAIEKILLEQRRAVSQDGIAHRLERRLKGMPVKQLTQELRGMVERQQIFQIGDGKQSIIKYIHPAVANNGSSPETDEPTDEQEAIVQEMTVVAAESDVVTEPPSPPTKSYLPGYIRLQVMRVLEEATRPLRAPEVIDEVQRDDPTISSSAIQKTLSTVFLKNEVKKVGKLPYTGYMLLDRDYDASMIRLPERSTKETTTRVAKVAKAAASTTPKRSTRTTRAAEKQPQSEPKAKYVRKTNANRTLTALDRAILAQLQQQFYGVSVKTVFTALAPNNPQLYEKRVSNQIGILVKEGKIVRVQNGAAHRYWHADIPHDQQFVGELLPWQLEEIALRNQVAASLHASTTEQPKLQEIVMPSSAVAPAAPSEIIVVEQPAQQPQSNANGALAFSFSIDGVNAAVSISLSSNDSTRQQQLGNQLERLIATGGRLLALLGSADLGAKQLEEERDMLTIQLRNKETQLQSANAATEREHAIRLEAEQQRDAVKGELETLRENARQAAKRASELFQSFGKD